MRKSFYLATTLLGVVFSISQIFAGYSWEEARISRDNAIFETKSDDGETGAGQVILHQLRKKNIVDVIVVVTRWFGGIKLQADRFKHLQNATIFWVDKELEK